MTLSKVVGDLQRLGMKRSQRITWFSTICWEKDTLLGNYHISPPEGTLEVDDFSAFPLGEICSPSLEGTIQIPNIFFWVNFVLSHTVDGRNPAPPGMYKPCK